MEIKTKKVLFVTLSCILLILFSVLCFRWFVFWLDQRRERNETLRRQAVTDRVECDRNCDKIKDEKKLDSCLMKCWDAYRAFIKQKRVSLF